MEYRRHLAQHLTAVLAAAGQSATLEECQALLEVPKDARMGDFAFPCFTLSKVLRKAPPAIAAELVAAVSEQVASDPHVASVEAAGPYLNFRIDRETLAEWLLPAVVDGEFLAPRAARGERVMIEYSQPNTHKSFHVGHTRNVALGDSLVRLCEWAGYDVVAANYFGDVGAHIAKCLWVFRQEVDAEQIPATHRGEFLGQLYTRAVELLDFTLITHAPHPGVITAKVAAKNPHPHEPKWSVVEVDLGKESKRVVCGGSGFEVGDVVPYATVGTRVGGREVAVSDKKGVESAGMICSEAEVSLGDDRQKIHVFPGDTPLGKEIAEICRIPGAFDPELSVIGEMRRREQGVSKVLQELEAEEPNITRLWRETRQWSLDEFAEIYRWLDARFDHDFYESDVGEHGKRLVKKFYDKGVFVRSEGAIGIDLSPYKLPFFLLLKSDGTGLYATKDLALAKRKFEEFDIDRSVYVVAEEQTLHFQQVFKTLELMGYEKAKDCFHLAYGMVVLPDGKMSSRKGNTILFSQLQQRLLHKIRTEHLQKFVGEWSEAEISETAHWVAVATIKYGMLNTDSRKSIVFDLDEWTSASGNTGPYLMYAYARTQSILRKNAQQLDLSNIASLDVSLLSHEREHDLLWKLSTFPEVATKAALEYEPQRICMFLYDVARDFSRFYKDCPVKDAESDALRNARGSLVAATGKVLEAGLRLLGITPLDRI